MNKTVFYIDPMSYNNLAIYDWNLIDNITNNRIIYIASEKYDFKEINVERINIFSYNKFNSKLLKSIFYCINILKLLLQIKKYYPDILHFQWFKLPNFDFFIIKFIKFIFPKIKIVFTAHNFLPHDSGNRQLKIYKKIYATVDTIITHTQNTKDELINIGISAIKIEIIKHGILHIETNISQLQTEKNKITEKFKLKNKTVFLNIGQIHKYKGTDILLEAWEATYELKNNPDIILIIAGNGKLDKYPLAQNVIVENRFLTDNEFIALLQLASVVVFPYRRISQSGVLLTALAEHKPILVTNVGGLPDPLNYADIGWVIPANNREKLTDTLLSIVKNPSNLQDITYDLQKWNIIEEQYSWKNIGKKTSLLYDKLFS